MPQTKYEYYTTLATQTTAQLTYSMENWTSFLETAARLYKYPFHDQLMIFAQRPDATACAEYDVWNKTMGRYVRRGSKGIALIDHTTGTPQIKYVYDLADTGTRQSSRPVNLWQMDEEHMDTVFYALEQNYSVSDIYLTDVLETIAASLAEEFWENHAADVLGILANSFLEEYTEDTVGVRFREAVTVSATYVLMARCGIKPEIPFTHEDFLPVFEFNTPDTIAALGTAVSTISRQVLRDIELSIKIYERTKANETEQPDLHDHRGLSVPQPDPGASADEAVGQIRTDAEDLSGGTPAGAVQSSDSVGEAVSAPVGDRPDSEPATGPDDERTGEDEWGDGDDEGDEPDFVGADDEQSESPSGRSDSDGTDLRITEPETEPTPYVRGTQISIFDMIPSEAEQIQAIDEAERVAHTPFAFSVPQDDIDTVLRMGSNTSDHRMRIIAEFMKQKSPQENGAFLQTIFHGGNGFHTASGELCVWYAEDGIHMAKGRSARYVPNAQIYDWTDAANRIREMLDAGNYAINVEIAEAVSHARKLLAGQLWDLYSSFSDVAREQYFDPAMFQGAHPDAVERVTQMLSDPATQNVIAEEISRFAADYAQDRSLLRFHYLPPAGLAKEIRELPDMTHLFATERTELPEVQQFITEDEIDEALASRGSGYERGQYRIHDFLTGAHTDKEKIAFLKKEYGLGGGSPALSGAVYEE